MIACPIDRPVVWLSHLDPACSEDIGISSMAPTTKQLCCCIPFGRGAGGGDTGPGRPYRCRSIHVCELGVGSLKLIGVVLGCPIVSPNFLSPTPFTSSPRVPHGVVEHGVGR